MAKTYLAFDTRSGRILSVHHGADDASHARQGVHPGRGLQHYTKVSDENIEVITVPVEAFERGKQYKVDISRKVLVEAVGEAGGVGFGFGLTARSSFKGPISS